MARCLAALACVRRGDLDAATEAIDGPDGIGLIRETAVVHSRICALGAAAELRRAEGDAEGVVAVALEAEDVIRPGDDATLSFSSGMLGHGAIAEGLIDVVSAFPDGVTVAGERVDVEALLERFLKRVRASARHHRGMRSRALLIAGLDAIRRGRERKGRSVLEKAIRASERRAMPYELGRSLAALSTISIDDRRETLRRRATDVFEKHGLVFELQRLEGGDNGGFHSHPKAGAA
jgi:hypothetical protein